MELKPGMRLHSAACTTEVVVVRPAGAPVALHCGGAPMVPDRPEPAAREPAAPAEPGTQLGKRYVHDSSGLEVLCTKPGAGVLSIADEPLQLKGTKPLPSSD